MIIKSGCQLGGAREARLPGSGDSGHSTLVDGMDVGLCKRGQLRATNDLVAQPLGLCPRKYHIGQPRQALRACQDKKTRNLTQYISQSYPFT